MTNTAHQGRPQNPPQNEAQQGPPEGPPIEVRNGIILQIVGDGVVTVIFLFAWWVGQDFAAVARWFPTTVGLVGAFVGTVKLVVDLRKLIRVRAGEAVAAQGREMSEEVSPMNPQDRRELLIWIGLLVALLAGIRIIGMVPAAALWLPAVLWLKAKKSLWLIGISAVGTVLLLLLMEAELGVRWPEPYLDVLEMLR